MRYWEILECDAGRVNALAVEAQALTYEGRLLTPGIERTKDLAHAIQIIRVDLNAHPLAVSHYFFLWDLELQKAGRSPAAYEQIGEELDAFLDTHDTSTQTFDACSRARITTDCGET